MKHLNFAEKIIALSQADFKLRDELVQKGELGDEYHPEMERLHSSNAQILDKIISEIGFPTKEKVGEKASEAAWLVVQHAISQPKFLKKCARLLFLHYKDQKAIKIQLAYLTDRIAFFEGRPQLYGTQFDWNQEGILVPAAIQDSGLVNSLRAAIGLNSLEEQTKIIQNQAKRDHQVPPKDYIKRKNAFTAWRKTVGWI